VALVHVPDVSAADAAILYPSRPDVEVPAGAAIWVYPAGRVGGVALPSRYAQTMIKSPVWCAGNVIVVVDAVLEPTREMGISYDIRKVEILRYL
jgi:hypothetical protein